MQVYTITPYIPLRPASRIFPNEHEKNGHFILVAEFFIAVGEGCCTSSGDMRMGDCTKFVFFAQNSGRAMSNVCRSSAVGKLHRLYEGATGDEPTPKRNKHTKLAISMLDLHVLQGHRWFTRSTASLRFEDLFPTRVLTLETMSCAPFWRFPSRHCGTLGNLMGTAPTAHPHRV
jgi:hypothetical protein